MIWCEWFKPREIDRGNNIKMGYRESRRVHAIPANTVPSKNGGAVNEFAVSRLAVVRADAVDHFDEFVESLGGNPHAILDKVAIDSAVIGKINAVVPYRKFILLLETAALELKCTSFGLDFALRQGGLSVLGPLEFAMANSETIGAAYEYCAANLQAYSPAVQIKIESDKESSRRYIQFDIVLDRAPHQQQAVEHAVALMHHAIMFMSKHAVRSREIWFSHEPVSSLSYYQRYFGTKVSFGNPINALFLDAADMQFPLENRSRQLYELATSYIHQKYPTDTTLVSTQVRVIVSALLASGKCTSEAVSDALGMHPRTLQRRLREEGTRFEDVKNEVRRDAALRYLGQKSISLMRVAHLLGYSEASVLSRSCQGWFAKSPRQIRQELALAELPSE
jgi:AraC-like DNA-binding protein